MNLYLRLLLLRIRNRKRRALGLWDTSRTTFRVLPTDLDLLGHVNNGKYLTLLDLGRMDLLVRAGFWQKALGAGWFPVVAGQTITYRKSLKLGQRFEIYTRIAGFHDRWVFVEQTLCRGDSVYAQAIVRTRFRKKSGGSVENEELRRITGDVPKDRVIPAWVQDWTAGSRTEDGTFYPSNIDP